MVSTCCTCIALFDRIIFIYFCNMSSQLTSLGCELSAKAAIHGNFPCLSITIIENHILFPSIFHSQYPQVSSGIFRWCFFFQPTQWNRSTLRLPSSRITSSGVNLPSCRARSQGSHDGFLKWWVSPTTMGFPTKNHHFGV